MHTGQLGLSVRRAQLSSIGQFDAYLVYYPPSVVQQEHDHGCTQFSALLAGSLTESAEGRTHEACPGHISAKPKGVVHSNVYGSNGAALLSFHIRCEETANAVLHDDGWHWRTVSQAFQNVALAIEPGNDCADLLWEVLAATERRIASDRPPDWLRWVRSTLDRGDGTVEIASLAQEAGVHRVYLSRQFVRHFGIPPSIYRSRQMAGRALRAIIDDNASAAFAAHDAGFVDQSHMARAIRSTFGTTPRRLAILLAN